MMLLIFYYVCVEYLFCTFQHTNLYRWIKGEHLFLFLKAFGYYVYSYFAESLNIICVHTLLPNNKYVCDYQWQIRVPPSLTFTAHPILVDDSGPTSSPPYINISVNNLCQDDEYTITVQFGVIAASSMDCVFQQNVTIMNGGRVDVPSDISLGNNLEYCYTAVLSKVAGDNTPSMRTYIYSIVPCVCVYLYYDTNNIIYT